MSWCHRLISPKDLVVVLLTQSTCRETGNRISSKEPGLRWTWVGVLVLCAVGRLLNTSGLNCLIWERGVWRLNGVTPGRKALRRRQLLSHLCHRAFHRGPGLGTQCIHVAAFLHWLFGHGLWLDSFALNGLYGLFVFLAWWRHVGCLVNSPNGLIGSSRWRREGASCVFRNIAKQPQPNHLVPCTSLLAWKGLSGAFWPVGRPGSLGQWRR